VGANRKGRFILVAKSKFSVYNLPYLLEETGKLVKHTVI